MTRQQPEEHEITESMVVNPWISRGEARGELKMARRDILELLNLRFPGKVSEEIDHLVNRQSDLDLLRNWFRAAAQVPTMEDFVKALRG